MDENRLNKLRELKKYIKFLNYRISHNTTKKDKFVLIRNWLKNEPSNLTLETLEKIELSINRQYRSCIIEKRVVPEEFTILFNAKGKPTEDTVIDLDEDGEIEFVSDKRLQENEVEKKDGRSEEGNNVDNNNEKTVQENDIRNENERVELENDVEIVSIDIQLSQKELTYNKEKQRDHSKCKDKSVEQNKSNAHENKCTSSEIICVEDDSSSDEEEEPVASTSKTTNTEKSCQPPPITTTNTVYLTSSDTENNVIKDFNNFDSASNDNCPLYYRREKNLNTSEVVTNSKKEIAARPLNKNICTAIPGSVLQQNSIIRKPEQKLRLNDPRIAKKLKMIEDSPLKNFINTDVQNHLVLLPVQQNQVKLPSQTIINEPDIKKSETVMHRTPMTYGEYKRLKEIEHIASKELKLAKEKPKSVQNFRTLSSEPRKQLETENSNRSPGRYSNSKEDYKKILSKTDKAIKELECTFKGYDTMEGFPYGKRNSSIKARFNIAEQLNDTESTLRKRRRSLSRCNDRIESYTQRRKRCKSVCEIDKDYIDSEDSINQGHFSFDIFEHLNKRKRLNQFLDDDNLVNLSHLNLIKPCSVQLERLSNDILSKYMKKWKDEKQVQCTDNAELIEGMVMIQEIPKNIPTQSNITQVTNTNISMTESNTRTCVLCKVKTKYLTSHYVHVHKSESYVSRLSEDDLVYLSVNIPFAIPVATGRCSKYNIKYEVSCGLCRKRITQPFQKLFEHYSKHTGEYAYGCYSCNKTFSELKEFTRHQTKSKHCKDYEPKTVYLYPMHLKTIHLYCCKICNFVQLNEANTFKHLRDHHYKRSDDPACIEKIILCAMDVSSINCEEMGLPNQDKNINVGNEPIVEESYEQENSNDGMDYLRTLSPCTFMDELLKEDYADEYEIDIKPDIVSMELTWDRISHLDKHQPIPLKIEKIDVIKARNSYKAHDSSLGSFGLLKCMAIDCNFTTNIDEEMLQHLKDHLNSILPPANILECSYCHYDAEMCSSPEMLIQHVREKHAASRFQCSVCNYRSCDSSNVFAHHKMFHSTQKKADVIYECVAPIVESSQRVDYMTQCWRNNVQKLNCPFCPQKYYSRSLMEEHCSNMHKNEEIDKLNFKIFSCIYCDCELFTRIKMQQHIALKHPDEFNFACERTSSKPNGEDLLENLRLYDITAMKFTGEIKSYAEELRKEEEMILNTVKEEKPVKVELLATQYEIVKASLRKLTQNTGVPPDRLFICPKMNCYAVLSNFEIWSTHMSYHHGSITYKCPHCTYFEETYDKTTFETHLNQHCLHTYVCFHCGETFAEQSSIEKHTTNIHQDITQFRSECIQVNRKYGYYISLSIELHEEKFTFLYELQAMILRRIDKLKEDTAIQLRSEWLVPLTNTVFEAFPNYNQKYIHSCISSGCSFRTRNSEQFIVHIKTHNFSKKYFTCNKCNVKFLIGAETDRLISHINMHASSKVHICDVCSSVYGSYSNLLKHVQSMHSKRDVFMISLNRTSNGKLLQLSVMFRVGRKTFSMNQKCFCCSTTNMESLAMHLREKHKIHLNYFCAQCSQKFENLQSCEGHFQKEHVDKDFQIYATLSSYSDIEMTKKNPVQLDVASCDYQQKTSQNEGAVDDADILAIYEGDDLIIAEEIRNMNAVQEKSPKINCIKIVNLEKLTGGSNNNRIISQSNVNKEPESANFVRNETPISPTEMPNATVLENSMENAAISGSSTRNTQVNPTTQQIPILNTSLRQPNPQQVPNLRTNTASSGGQTSSNSPQEILVMTAGSRQPNPQQHIHQTNTTKPTNFTSQLQNQVFRTQQIRSTLNRYGTNMTTPARYTFPQRIPVVNTSFRQPTEQMRSNNNTNKQLPARTQNFTYHQQIPVLISSVRQPYYPTSIREQLLPNMTHTSPPARQSNYTSQQ